MFHTLLQYLGTYYISSKDSDIGGALHCISNVCNLMHTLQSVHLWLKFDNYIKSKLIEREWNIYQMMYGLCEHPGSFLRRLIFQVPSADVLTLVIPAIIGATFLRLLHHWV